MEIFQIFEIWKIVFQFIDCVKYSGFCLILIGEWAFVFDFFSCRIYCRKNFHGWCCPCLSCVFRVTFLMKFCWWWCWNSVVIRKWSCDFLVGHLLILVGCMLVWFCNISFAVMMWMSWNFRSFIFRCIIFLRLSCLLQLYTVWHFSIFNWIFVVFVLIIIILPIFYIFLNFI